MFQNTLNRVLSEYNSENNWSQKFVKDSNLKHLANSDKYYSYDIKYKADIQEEYSIFKTKYNKRNVIKRHYNSRDREPLRIVDYSYTIYEEEII